MPHRYFADETDLGLGKRLADFLPGEVVYPGHPDLPELVVNLWQDDMLCIPPQSTAQAEPSIICAMGFR